VRSGLKSVGLVTACLILLNSLLATLSYISGSFQGVVFVVIMSAVLFYVAVARIYKGQIHTDIIVLFPSIYLIYTFSFPLLRHVFRVIDTDILGVSYAATLSGTLLAGLVINGYMVLVLMFYRGHKLNFCKLGTFKIEYSNAIFDAFALLFAAQYLANFFSTGGFALLGAGMSRLEAVRAFNAGADWLINYYFVCYSGYTIISIMNRKGLIANFKLANFCRGMSIVVYWVTYLLIGNRRALLYLVLMLVFYVSTKTTIKPQLKHKAVVIAIMLMLLLMGYYRTAFFAGEAVNFEALVEASLGDFFFPIQTLYHYIDHSPSFMLGATYLNVIPRLVPRFLWINKPPSLAQQFAIDLGSEMGYAFTPATEGFINFSYFMILFLPIILFAFFVFITKISKHDTLLYLIVYVQLVNFNRGEFASSVLEILIMYFFVTSMHMVNSLGRMPQRRR